LCISFGAESNPFICTNPCQRASDCPGNYVCAPTGDGYSFCYPLSDPYTCSP
jgi:hypothetical protein